MRKWAIRLFESKDKEITASKVNIPANVSSQYISALMLVASKLEMESKLEAK
jgi:5-enolpyruvylshikimate-3-phosphate synthase